MHDVQEERRLIAFQNQVHGYYVAIEWCISPTNSILVIRTITTTDV